MFLEQISDTLKVLVFISSALGELGGALYASAPADSIERRVVRELNRIYANFIVYG